MPTQIDRISIPADPAAVAGARRFTEDCLDRWGLHPLIDTAILLISEVVTNAIIHGHSASEITLTLDGAVLRAEVRDQSANIPRTRNYSNTATTGRGMLIVEALSSAWGAEADGEGKVVWFEMIAGNRHRAATLLPTAAASGVTEFDSRAGGQEAQMEPPAGLDLPSARVLLGAGA